MQHSVFHHGVPCSEAAPQHLALQSAIVESSIRPGRLGVYSRRQLSSNSLLAETNESLFILPIADANKNEWSPWHDYIKTYQSRQLESLLLANSHLLLEHQFRTDIMTTGIAAFMTCSFHFSNVQAPWKDLLSESSSYPLQEDSFNVSRSDPTAGSFVCHTLAASSHTHGFYATTDIWPGEELVLPCDPELDDATVTTATQRKVLDLDYLHQSGVCLTNALAIQPSTIPKAGRGAFAKKSFQPGQVIESSPVLHFDRSQVERVHQEYYNHQSIMFETRSNHNIRYENSKVLGYQLWMNYCLTSDKTIDEESHVMLFPLQPSLAMLNHPPTEQQQHVRKQQSANARLEWSTAPSAQSTYLQSLRPMELFANPFNKNELLVLSVVATREIAQGDEVWIDYGASWARAFAEHTKQYDQQLASVDRRLLEHVSDPQSFAAEHGHDYVRTLSEQSSNPYPINLQTACYFEHLTSEEEELYANDGSIVWTSDHHGCLRPCDVLDRTFDRIGRPVFKVSVYELDNMATPDVCKLSDLTHRVDSIQVINMPASAIRVIHKKYASDTFFYPTFRHSIGVPAGLLPQAWAAKDPNPTGDFLVPSYLPPGMMEHIRWKNTGDVVTPNAYVLGISDRVRRGLLQYCNATGITDILRHVTIDGNGLVPDDDMYLTINNEKWYLQRPGKNWHSDLHWLSPAAHPAHEDYLQALGASGFDEMLQGVGNHLKLDGLVAFHVTFIAVSQAIRGYVHYDVSRTQAKTYNIIIPLMLADDTGPELDLQQWPALPDGSAPIGRLKYRYGMAAMMGDDSYHATSSVDYRPKKEMRLAATVYVADVNEINVEHIQDQYTQAFPPRDSQLLMSWAGRHWKPYDSSRKLPTPVSEHILLQKHEPSSAGQSLLRRVKVLPDSDELRGHGNVLEEEYELEEDGDDEEL